jgi:soluble lytic murein transglycosylase-like protein
LLFLSNDWNTPPPGNVFAHTHLPSYVESVLKRSLRGKWKGQAGRIASTILTECQKHSLDPLLVLAVIESESSFRPQVEGRHGEIGLMQLQPETARWIHEQADEVSHLRHSQLKSSPLPDSEQLDLHNPLINLRIGIAYLGWLKREFQEVPAHYLAAYNMGPNRVQRLIRSMDAGDVKTGSVEWSSPYYKRVKRRQEKYRAELSRYSS